MEEDLQRNQTKSKKPYEKIHKSAKKFRPRNQKYFMKIKEENRDKIKKKEKDIAKIEIKSNEEQKLLENFKIVTRQFL